MAYASRGLIRRLLPVAAVLAFAPTSDALSLRHGSGSRGLHATLTADRLKKCSYEVVMFDSRNLTDERSVFGMLVPQQYQSLTAVLNYAYAKQFGYNFTFVQPDVNRLRPKYSLVWHRVFYFAERLSKIRQTGNQCTWLVYIDTDAFVREFRTPLHEFLSRMASKYHISDDVGAIFAQEQTDPPMMPWTWHAINGGVYMVQVNERSRHLFDVWQNASKDDEELKHEWPAEQGVLTELYFPGKYHTRQGPFNGVDKGHAHLRKHDSISNDIALVNMTEMNSPWGRFIEHDWSGPGWQKRERSFTDMLARINASEPERFEQLLNEARGHRVEWVPTAPGSGST